MQQHPRPCPSCPPGALAAASRRSGIWPASCVAVRAGLRVPPKAPQGRRPA